MVTHRKMKRLMIVVLVHSPREALLLALVMLALPTQQVLNLSIVLTIPEAPQFLPRQRILAAHWLRYLQVPAIARFQR